MKLGALTVILALASGAVAAEPVRLARPAGDATMPRITAPSTPATARINAALARLDKRWAGYVDDCEAGGKDNEAARSVEVTMAGPRFLSLVAHDEEFCGGAHPDNSTTALVYDLQSGRPVDWRILLGPRLAGVSHTDTVIDGTTIGVINSAELAKLYLRALRKSPDYDPAWWDQCSDTLKDPSLEFLLWPDAKTHGLVADPEVEHVVAPCGEEVSIPAADLRAAGADAALIAALRG
jgi:hypothetical protein